MRTSPSHTWQYSSGDHVLYWRSRSVTLGEHLRSDPIAVVSPTLRCTPCAGRLLLLFTVTDFTNAPPTLGDALWTVLVTDLFSRCALMRMRSLCECHVVAVWLPCGRHAVVIAT